MKQYVLPAVTAIVALSGSPVHAQAPQGISYQAIARNSEGAVLSSETIGVRFSIHDGSASGAVVYSETFSPTTAASGLFTLIIGTGTPVTGTFAAINWGGDSKFLQIELLPPAAADYIDMGTQQMMSVPYALYAQTAGTSAGWADSVGHLHNTNPGRVGIGTTTPKARLHVADSSVVFTGPDQFHIRVSSDWPSPPVSGGGSRMMWYAGKGAFRAGGIEATEWDKDSTGIFSTATGLRTKAIGNFSVAMGLVTTARANSAVAMGQGTTASGQGAIALGLQSVASGYSAVAIGANAIASGSVSIAMGNGSNATNSGSIAIGTNCLSTGGLTSSAIGHYCISGGDASVAIGFGSKSNGYASTAMGYYTTAIGFSTTAIGDSTSASGIASVATGKKTNASGDYATAMGFSTIASGRGAVAIGNWAEASGYTSVSIGEYTKASGNYSTAMGLHVSTAGYMGAFIIGDNNGGTNLNSTSNNEMTMRFAGGFKLFTNGTATVGTQLAPGGNSWATISDRRKKENFSAVDGEAFLKKITKMELTSWNYIGQDPRQHRHYGPMAQDFYAAFGNDGVGTIGNDTTINQADMEGVSFVAIQALVQRTEDLKKENDLLKQQLAQYKQENSNLKAEITHDRQETNARLHEIELLLRKENTASK